jgi:type VI secretion system secreted protein Hcp
MAVNSFINFFDKAEGESIQKGKEKWIEIQSWDWEVESETSWTKGSGASVGKPNPGKMNFQHFFDTAAPVILGYICSGKAFPRVDLHMMKTTGKGSPETYFSMIMEGVFITRVSNSGTDEGNVMQGVQLIFKTVRIEYKPLDTRTGLLGVPKLYNWDITTGIASPSA